MTFSRKGKRQFKAILFLLVYWFSSSCKNHVNGDQTSNTKIHVNGISIKVFLYEHLGVHLLSLYFIPLIKKVDKIW